MRVLVTGANGFVGSHLCQYLIDAGHFVRRAVRVDDGFEASNIETKAVGSIDSGTQWNNLLTSIDVVVHLAACVHQFGGRTGKNKNSFNQVNVEGVKKLVSDAVNAKIKRFIFVSSTKVYAEKTKENEMLTEQSETNPIEGDYGQSKLDAERIIQESFAQSQTDFAIIRPPLIYGPHVGANFESLMNLLNTGMPLPFSGINNQRSMLAIENLSDFIQHCCMSKEASNQIFLLSDDRDLSIIELMSLIRKFLGTPPRLFYIPKSILKLIALLIGRSSTLGKLVDDFQVSPQKAIDKLGWKPIISVDKALEKTVKSYLENQK